MKETESSKPTPEQLLQMLDASIQLQRARRQGAKRNRVMFLTIGVLFILTGAAVALLVLSQMLYDSPGSMHGQPVAVQD